MSSHENDEGSASASEAIPTPEETPAFKMTLSRFAELKKREDAGEELNLTNEELGAYRRNEESLAKLQPQFISHIRGINKSIDAAFKHQGNLAKTSRLISNPPQDQGPLESIREIQKDLAASSESAAESRRILEEENLNLARSQNDALRAIANELQSQSVASASMAGHQKRMNWWILGVTALGVVVALVLFLFSRIFPA